MAGVILLTAMAVGGITLWLKRRRERKELRHPSKMMSLPSSAKNAVLSNT